MKTDFNLPVIHATDCICDGCDKPWSLDCDSHGEPWCPECMEMYAECAHPGPTSAEEDMGEDDYIPHVKGIGFREGDI